MPELIYFVTNDDDTDWEGNDGGVKECMSNVRHGFMTFRGKMFKWLFI